MKRLLTVLTFVLFIAVTAGYSAEKVAQLPAGVSIHQLDNGIEVLLIENPAVPMVGVNVVIKVGSAYETFATSGMSHMLEHLLFNGTTSREQKKLYDDVDLIGGYNNANTSEYYTNFMMVTPAENISSGMEIQSDMLFNSILPGDKFEKEKGIVLEEIARSLADPRQQAERNIMAILYNGHALSLPTLGTYATIEAMDRDAVEAFYRNNYVPNNMILSAVGNFNIAEMLARIKETYGKAKPSAVSRPAVEDMATGFESPRAAAPAPVSHRFYGGDELMLDLFYPIENTIPAYYELLDLALDKIKDPVKKALEDKFGGDFKSLSLSTMRSVLQNYIRVAVRLTPESDVNAAAMIVQKILSNQKAALPAETVQAEATRARTEYLRNIEKPHMFGIYNANDFAVSGIEAVLAGYDPSNFTKAAKKLSDVDFVVNPVIIVQHPASGNETETTVVKTATELFPAKPGSATLIVRQNAISDLLAVHFMVKNKSALEAKYGKNAAQILHDCFEQRMKSDANQESSRKYGFSYVFNDNPYIPMDNIYLDANFGYIRAEGLATDLPGAISFLTGQIMSFVPTEDEFNTSAGKFAHTGRPMGGQKAQEVFNKKWKSEIYTDDPYAEMPELTYDSLLKFSKEYFIPANMIVSVVSPAEPQKLAELFSGFNGPESILTTAAPVVEELKMKTAPVDFTEEGGGEQSYLFYGFTREIEPADAAAVQGLSLVLADRIIFDIREKQGMAYRMSAGIEQTGNKALFYIRLGTRPQNTEKLVPQFPSFFDVKKLADISDTEVRKSINMYLGRMMFRRLSSINQGFYLAQSLYFHNDINYDAGFLADLKNVSVGDIQRVANKYMKVVNPVSVVVK